MSDAKPQAKSSVTVIGNTMKADTAAIVTNGAVDTEDSFVGSYWTGGNTGAVAILEPQFKPASLYALTTQNNVLSQCVEAMEVNIDGTGHSISPSITGEGEKEDEKEKQMLTDFFDEPYPGKSMMEVRKAIRRDLEILGNGYMEVIRNAADEIVMINNLDAVDIRLIRVDDPVFVEVTLTRGGKEVVSKIRKRERRFVQLINGKKTYFKEFGASRDVNRLTGEWATDKKKRLPLEERGSEVIHFTGNKEPKTPYGIPRWLNQLPSVMGSRKAEEYNLEYFDSGGLPPLLVIVQGGTLGTEVRDELVQHLSSQGKNRHRAAVVEAVSTSGSLDSSGSVQVKVERFGGDRMADAMFQQYDANCSEHIRMAFRLPLLFVGKAQDMNFASSYTAYMVAEAQVFYPEREEFDAHINTKIVRGLGAKKYKFRSLPMTLVDVANQLKALEMVTTSSSVSPEDVVKTLNEVTGLSLEYTEPPKPPEPPPPPQAKIDPLTGLPYKEPVPPQHPPTLPPTPEGKTAPTPANEASGSTINTPPSPQNRVVWAPKGEIGPTDVVVLAGMWAATLGLDGATDLSDHEKNIVRKAVAELDEDSTKLLNQILATKTMKVSKSDLNSMAELCSCISHVTE